MLKNWNDFVRFGEINRKSTLNPYIILQKPHFAYWVRAVKSTTRLLNSILNMKGFSKAILFKLAFDVLNEIKYLWKKDQLFKIIIVFI